MPALRAMNGTVQGSPGLRRMGEQVHAVLAHGIQDDVAVGQVLQPGRPAEAAQERVATYDQALAELGGLKAFVEEE